MGVKDLYKLIAASAPGAISEVDVAELDGWTVAVDASLSIYQLHSMGEKHKIVNTVGAPINAILGTFYRVAKMITSGITPAYVFDGAPPAAKSHELAQRKSMRTARAFTGVPRGVFAEIARLVMMMGATSIQAPGEAESQAALLTRNDSLDAVLTEDMDVIPLGATTMVRGWSVSASTVTLIETDLVLKGLGLTRGQFVDLCIMLGTDYTITTLAGIGPKRALAAIREHGSLEKILATVKDPPSATNFDYIEARVQFMRPNVTPTKFKIALRKLGLRDIVAIREFMVTTHKIAPSMIEATLHKLAAYYAIKY